METKNSRKNKVINDCYDIEKDLMNRKIKRIEQDGTTIASGIKKGLFALVDVATKLNQGANSILLVAIEREISFFGRRA